MNETMHEIKDTSMDKANEPDILRGLPAELQLYMPILRVDKEKREVVARATSEALDGHKTIFKYTGSKEAFSKWRGNIREMHDPTKAVGRALKVSPNDDEKAVDVTLRVSRGAEDTWQKVLDGTLSGLSVGARNGKWITETINGESVPVLERYDLVEVSLVDNPSNPDANISIIRADGVATEVLDVDVEDAPQAAEAEAEPERTEEADIERIGAKHSVETASKLHASRDHSLMAARSAMDNCGCEECKACLAILDPDNDGDVDIVDSLDTDDDDGAVDGNGQTMNKAAVAEIVRMASEEITRRANEETTHQITPLVSTMRALLARFAQIDTTPKESSPEITRRLEVLEGMKTELDEVRADLSAVKGLTEQIASQPAHVVGPIVNANRMMSAQPKDRISELAQAVRSGTATKDQQLEAASMLISDQLRRQ